MDYISTERAVLRMGSCSGQIVLGCLLEDPNTKDRYFEAANGAKFEEIDAQNNVYRTVESGPYESCPPEVEIKLLKSMFN